MTTPTPKRLAADIIRKDIELVQDWWQERLEGCGIRLDDAEAREIQRHIDSILEPLHKRLNTIAKDVSILDHGKQSDDAIIGAALASGRVNPTNTIDS